MDLSNPCHTNNNHLSFDSSDVVSSASSQLGVRIHRVDKGTMDIETSQNHRTSFVIDIPDNMMTAGVLDTSDSIIFERREKGTIRVEPNAVLQGSTNEYMDPVTNINAHMSALKLSPSCIQQSSRTTAPRVLTWNEEAILYSYAIFKGVDSEKDVKLLYDIKHFKRVMDLFVVDEGEKKSLSVIFLQFSSYYNPTDR